jgi:hypothetical protein
VRGKPITVPGQDEKGGKMEEQMTDYQFKKLLEMVLEILKGSKDKEEAVEKIEALLNQ